jgi:hypothetical protein
MFRNCDRPAFGFKVPNLPQLLLSTLEFDRNGILGVKQDGFAKYNVAAAMVGKLRDSLAFSTPHFR